MDRFYHRSLRIVRGAVLSATMIGLILVLGIVVVPSASADEAACSTATIKGSYAFRFQGIVPLGHNGGIGVVTFDGKGIGVTVGTITRDFPPGVTRSSSPFSYKVNPNCTGSIDDGVGFTYDFVIADGGNEVFMVVTREDFRVVIWVLKKQFPRQEDGQDN